MTSIDIDTLVERLQQARDAYYDADPLMSDVEYDALEDQLREAAPSHPFLQQVGAKATQSGWVKVKHGAPMGSLEKCQTNDEVRKWYVDAGRKLQSAVGAGELPVLKQEFVISEKLDGISCFSGETEVLLANGERITIEDLVAQEGHPMVLTWCPQEKITERRTIAVHDNGIREGWLRLTLEDGSQIVVTEDHEFYVRDEGWCRAADLLGKDLLDCEDKC